MAFFPEPVTFVDLQNKASFSNLVLLTWNAIAAFSEESVERVLLLYLVVSSALER